jgi:DNA-directed RNA polymerase specialized sigma subunit
MIASGQLPAGAGHLAFSRAEAPMAIISSPAVPAAEPMQAMPAPSGQIPEDLSELDDRELLALATSLPGASGRRAAARDLLVSRGLVLSCVRQYSRDPELAEDLTQVGYVGLLKAINNFDPAFGCGLSSYARSYMWAVTTHWGELPAREQKVLILRFYGGMTQTQIGQQLGISQMQVSRLLARALGYLRPRVTGLPERPIDGAASA